MLEHVACELGGTQLQPSRLELAFAFLHGCLRGGEQPMLVAQQCGQASDEWPHRLSTRAGAGEHPAARRMKAIGEVPVCDRTRRFD